MIFLQETHKDIYNQAEWLNEWKGQRFLSHGSSVSAGVALLISESTRGGGGGGGGIIYKILFINVYAPNIGCERVFFLKKVTGSYE